jgi:uncharacterized protein (TIGR03437 family)
MIRLFLSSVLLIQALVAQAPASLPVKVEVPSSLRRGVFSSDRTLNVPPGFRISLFALVSGARFLAVAPNGDVLVSTPGSGKIVLLRPDANGGVPKAYDFATGLRKPHDMAFHTIGDRTYLYVSETNQINRFLYSPGDTTAHDRQVVVTGLPDSSTPELRGAYGHELKNIALDGDDKLYVSIGSSCNACTSDTTSNPVRASIYQYNADGSGGRLFARGLRNAEGLAILPEANTLWVAVNNRDDISYPQQDASGRYGKVVASYVDNHPTELFTAVRDGGNYGWPFCNSNPDSPSGFDNLPFDRDYDMNRDGHVDCGAMDTVMKGIQAHSAPLGMIFLQNTAFAAAYRNGAVVALHGSWNRTVKTGYKVIYFPWDSGTQRPGAQIDLVSGWLNDSGQQNWGRPVDIAVDLNGSLLISDDQTGAIYQLSAAPVIVNAAGGAPALAPDSLGSIFGLDLVTETATAPGVPLPTTLSGVTLSIKDSSGAQVNAPLLFVSRSQINFVMPASVALGKATLSVQNGPLVVGTIGIVNVTRVAPGLFTMNNSAGAVAVAAATAIRQVISTRIQSPVTVFNCSAGNCKPVPIDVGVDAPVYLSLYATGVRGRTSLDNVTVTIGGVNAPVLFAGPQPSFTGLDQVNVALPLSLRGRGEVDVVLTVDGQTSNPARIAIQ